MSAWTCQPSDGKAAEEIVPLRPRIPWWKGLVPIPKRSASPWVTSTPQVVDSLKALDPNRPIREADIQDGSEMTRLTQSGHRPP